jgi:hypothetical protein
MDKNIGAVFTLDKAESLGFIKPFNSASCCRHSSYLYCLRRHVAASIYLVIIYNRTDELDGTSTANINTAETTQHMKCSTIFDCLTSRSETILSILRPFGSIQTRPYQGEWINAPGQALQRCVGGAD